MGTLVVMLCGLKAYSGRNAAHACTTPMLTHALVQGGIRFHPQVDIDDVRRCARNPVDRATSLPCCFLPARIVIIGRDAASKLCTFCCAAWQVS